MTQLPIISSEEHQCVVVNAAILQGLNDLPHCPVQLVQRVSKLAP